MQYSDGTLFMDHSSKFVFNYNQVYLGAGEILAAKHAFESTHWSVGYSVSNYHGDNGIFASQTFKDDCHVKQYKITSSGLVRTIKMQLLNAPFRLLLDRQGHCCCTL